jgi:hypothetical protein
MAKGGHADREPQGLRSEQPISFHIEILKNYLLSGALCEIVQSTSLLAVGNQDGPGPILEIEVKPTKVVHCLSSSPPTREPSPKKHKGKQKASSRRKLKEFLSNLEDEMICPMSVSAVHLDDKARSNIHNSRCCDIL